MISALNKLDNGTLELTITIPWKRVDLAYQKVLKEVAQETELKGFRKGKAPAKMVEKTLGKSRLFEKTLKALIPNVYAEAVKEQKVKPVATPRFEVLAIGDQKDWQIKAITCAAPSVQLGQYREAIKKELAGEKIWVPGQDKKAPANDQATQDKRLRQVFTVLLKTAKIKVPQLLIENETNRMLAHLVDQTGRLGITIQEYLNSLGKTQEQLRKEYATQAEETLRLELILDEIAKKEKVTIEEKEIETAVKAVPDKKAREKMATPVQKAYIRQLLTKRAVIDKLMKL